ncbi:MAG: GHKL domain-containing protein [Oscillospiraceae bacterium]|nr:GHKL domain-containing protein [Oscillospiraceae bacterium]
MVEKNKLPLFVLLISSAIILMYVENAVIVNNTFGLGDLNRSVQSVWNYIACPYKISTGTLTVFRVLSKLSGCLTIFFLSSVFLSSDSRFRWCVVLFPVLAELCMHLMKSSQHIFSIFSPEKLIRDYNFCSIYGIIVDYTLIFEIITVLLLAFSSVWSSHTVEKMLLNEKNLAERRYYDEINEKYNETRMIRHDIKNHLTAVAILIDDGKIDDARKYLDDISSEMDRVRPPVNTGSLVLDSLLFRKASDMKKKKIELVIAFLADFSKCPVSEYDLCSIFGNILDNAMEATEKLPDEKRCIHLTVKRQLDMICIICENPFEQINEDLSTQKSDKAYHGFGLKRIRRIAENYSGDVRINSSDSIFRISVLLNTGTEK